jgi:Domain of unknown function (DUF3244)
MKKLKSIFVLMVCLISCLPLQTILAGRYPIALADDNTNSDPTRPRMLAMQSVSAIIDDTQLEVYFGSPVGVATITVYDANNNILYQETMDTDSISEVFISTDSWTSGTYSLKISYSTTRVTGEFQTE